MVWVELHGNEDIGLAGVGVVAVGEGHGSQQEVSVGGQIVLSNLDAQGLVIEGGSDLGNEAPLETLEIVFNPNRTQAAMKVARFEGVDGVRAHQAVAIVVEEDVVRFFELIDVICHFFVEASIGWHRVADESRDPRMVQEEELVCQARTVGGIVSDSRVALIANGGGSGTSLEPDV